MKNHTEQNPACSPCASGWAKLLGNLGKTKADDEPLAITTILESNGVDDALQIGRDAVDGYQREMRLFAVERRTHGSTLLMTDQRSIDALDVCRTYADGRQQIKRWLRPGCGVGCGEGWALDAASGGVDAGAGCGLQELGWRGLGCGCVGCGVGLWRGMRRGMRPAALFRCVDAAGCGEDCDNCGFCRPICLCLMCSVH